MQVWGFAHQNVGQRCLSWTRVCFAVSVWFFHLSDNSYPMHDLCSMYFTTPCDNQNPALNFFTTKETRTLPHWPFTGHLAMLQSFLTCEKTQSLWKSRLRWCQNTYWFFTGVDGDQVLWHEISVVGLLLKKRRHPTGRWKQTYKCQDHQ